MVQGKLFELYEKLYFHEVEAKERISGRLQIPLAISLSIIGVFAHIFKGLTLKIINNWCVLFWFLFGISLLLFIVSLVYFIRSFYGHSYQFLPPANQTEDYRQKLLETYKDYDNREELTEKYFNKYLYDYYNDCSSANTEVNDLRSEMLHKCNTYLILCALPLFGTFLLFTLAGIDKNSIEKEYRVNITNPLVIENVNSSKNREINNSKQDQVDNNMEIINGQRATKTTAPPTTKTTKENNKRGRSDTEANSQTSKE